VWHMSADSSTSEADATIHGITMTASRSEEDSSRRAQAGCLRSSFRCSSRISRRD
jgi:hypothetical protein